MSVSCNSKILNSVFGVLDPHDQDLPPESLLLSFIGTSFQNDITEGYNYDILPHYGAEGSHFKLMNAQDLKLV